MNSEPFSGNGAPGDDLPPGQTAAETSILKNIHLDDRFKLLKWMSMISASVLFLFSAIAAWQGVAWFSTFLALIGLFTCYAIYLMRSSANHERALKVIGLSGMLLGYVLVFSGGIQGYGIYWSYPILALIIFTIRFEISLVLSVSFVLITSLSLLFKAPWALFDYPPGEVVRYTMTLSILCIMCLAREYASNHSMGQMDDLHKALREVANTDALTGLFNRRFISDNYIHHDQFAESINDNSAVLLADIDHFKQVNDTFGHDVGDQVLKMVADKLTEATRADDIVARWGGEEFLMILPNVSAEIAEKRANQFIERVREEVLYLDAGELRLTMSIGISYCRRDAKASDILKEADERLYRAKTEGRNRVVCS